MSDDSSELDLVRQIRERLKNLESHKKIVPEKIAEEPNKKADEEASAIANKDYDHVEEERKKAEIQSIYESNRDARANRLLRWKYAKWVFCYLVSYSIFVGVVLMLSAFKILGFNLEASVLEFLVGSTAASAIGLVFAVTHGLFSK